MSKNLDVLKNELLNDLEKTKKSKLAIIKLDEENVNLMDKVHLKNIEVVKMAAKIKAIGTEIKRLKDNMNNLQNEKKLENSKIDKENKEIEDKNIAVAKYILSKNEIQQSINEVNYKLKDKLLEIEEIKELINNTKIKKAKIDETINNKQSEIQRLNDEMIVYNDKVIVFSNEIKESMKNKNISELSIKSKRNKISETNDRLKSMEKRFEDNEVKRIKIKDHIKINGQQLEDVTLTIEKIEKNSYNCELSIAKVEMEKETYYDKLNKDFELTFAEALQFKHEIEDIDKLKNEIGKLKSEISMLGKINVSAIEEYKEVKDKFTFMNGQKEDLVLAKNELLTVIHEMTEKMKKLFADSFVILRQNFNDTFTELFKGGSADLILTEGDELTAKIDINVEPPGKKLQNINLMSGGEKVLSAIALLFAILKMKPTPFCILDEIEAALDDANVVRYAEFLKRFSDNVQFIIITHRKGTMEVGDVLYGVTMEEKGISKIVSVDFNK